jgi:FkbM family methyltransferase
MLVWVLARKDIENMRKEGEGCGQHGEDRILSLVFRNQKHGLLIDVGAADGYWNSNSRILLQRPGWTGVLIEPEPEQFEKLNKMYTGRPGISCVNCGIGLERGKQTFYCGGQVSTFKEEIKHSAEVNHKIQYIKTDIWITTLTNVLDDIGVEVPIDFLSIDAEGMNYEVWQSLDKQKYSPKLVCIEGKKYAMKGYKELCRVGCNTFYLKENICNEL